MFNRKVGAIVRPGVDIDRRVHGVAPRLPGQPLVCPVFLVAVVGEDETGIDIFTPPRILEPNQIKVAGHSGLSDGGVRDLYPGCFC